MKLNCKKYSYLTPIIIIGAITLFSYKADSSYSLYQESISSSSGQFSIPSCTKCDPDSEIFIPTNTDGLIV